MNSSYYKKESNYYTIRTYCGTAKSVSFLVVPYPTPLLIRWKKKKEEKNYCTIPIITRFGFSQPSYK